MIYLDGAGCYGMNGHDDAAADAALLAKASGRPVRVQWMRADELGWDPKGPPQLIEIRAQGKVANCFAVESMIDQPAAAAKMDPLEFRLRDVIDARGVEVLKRCAALIGWTPRPSPRLSPEVAQKAGKVRGRGIAYIHYKHNESYAAVAKEVEVDRADGAIRALQMACAHDCGLMINPDAVHNQVEGNLLQTLSRTLYERTTFNAERVTSTSWASYPILRFLGVPALHIELIQRTDQPPLGAGEASATPVPAALANAVFDATGVRLLEVPFAPPRVLAALRAQARA